MASQSLASIHGNPILTFEPSQQAGSAPGNIVSQGSSLSVFRPSFIPIPFQFLFNPNAPNVPSSPTFQVPSVSPGRGCTCVHMKAVFRRGVTRVKMTHKVLYRNNSNPLHVG